MNGKKRNIRKKDFLVFADECDISPNSTEKMMEKIVSLKGQFISMCNSSLMPDYLKESFIALIEERMRVLENYS